MVKLQQCREIRLYPANFAAPSAAIALVANASRQPCTWTLPPLFQLFEEPVPGCSTDGYRKPQSESASGRPELDAMLSAEDVEQDRLLLDPDNSGGGDFG